MKETELKPCPFCGGKDIRKITTLSFCEIFCCKCKACIQRGLYMGKYDCLEEAEADFGVKATNAWNRRADNEQRETD